MLTVKADKAAVPAMDAPVGIDFDERAVFLFDAASGARIRGDVGAAGGT